MDSFDRNDADNMGYEQNPREFNANDEIEVDMDVMDHDEFESASDEDGLERIRNRKLKQLRKQGKTKDGSVPNTVFFVGKEFATADDVKKDIHKLLIETRRELFLKKNDKVRVRAECRGTIPVFEDTPQHGPSDGGPSQASGSSPKTKWTKAKVSESKGIQCSPQSKSKYVGGKPNARKLAANQCPFVIHVSKLRDSETWQVKTFDDTHKCLQSRKIKYCTADFLSTDIMQQIETNPEIPIKSLQEQLQKKFQLEVSRMKAFRAKSKAVDSVRGDYTLQYKMLRDYVMELKECNPNTTVRIGVETEEDHTSPTRIFKRIYVCLGASKAGFKACRREFLGLDGAFMKGPFPGQLLTTVGIDPNNGIYPLAYGIVETESRESWTWFLEHLKDDLDLQDNSNFTFISDRQKGIIPAIAELFLAAEHRFCLRHIHENMKQKWAGTAYKELLWNCATTLTIPQFDRRMNRLKEFNKECYDWLALIPPQHWARAHFSGRAKTDMLLNNMCEVFNGQLLDGRDRPIISSLEYAREYLMKRTVTVLQTIAKSDGPLTPTATKLFQAIKNEATECVAQCNGGHLKWELTGMPCKHAVASIWNMAANRVDVGVPETWPKSNIPTIILPPNHHPQVGRPPKKIKRSAGEGIPMMRNNKLSRRSQTITCVLCHGKGHNKRTCKGQQVPKVNKTAATTRRGASASSVKASTSGLKVATHKGNNTSASVKVAASGSKVATHKGNNTFASVKVAASGLKAIQPSGNVKGGNVKTAGKVKGAATGSKAAAQNGKKILPQREQDGTMVDEDDTQDTTEDEQQLNHVREWIKSYLDDVDVIDALSAFPISHLYSFDRRGRGWDNKSIRMERKLTRNINKPNCDTDRENSDGGDAHQCLSICHFEADAREACLDSFGEHVVHCKELPGFKYLHDMVRDILFDICRRARISVKKEAPMNFLTDPSDGRSTLRPADILVFGWVGGKHACVDLTRVSPLMGLSSQGFTVGEAALKVASYKVTKHEKACFENQHVFIPFAFDTFGFFAPEAVELLTRVQCVMNSNVMTYRSTNVVFNRIGFAIQKGLAAQLVARLPSPAM
ncbi:mutator type transposase [Tanacetum coccineum]